MAKKTETRGAFVRIQSTKTINVTPGLNFTDVSNPDAHVPDRLRVIPLWPQATVQIHEGTGLYPSEIVEWDTVKSLQDHNIITIGEFCDSADEKEEEVKRTLDRKLEEIEKKETRKKSIEKLSETKSLEEIVEE